MRTIKEIVRDELKAAQIESQRMWGEGYYSHAYIVGYLQGAIKSALRQLEDEKAN